MLKFLIGLIVATLFAGFAVHGLRVFDELWAQKCITSGFLAYNRTVDFQRYVSYRNCTHTTLNRTQFREDYEEIIKKMNSTEPDYATIQLTLQRYCAPAKAFLRCGNLLSTECFTNEELLRESISTSMRHSYLDFFCDNEAEGLAKFTKQNGLECLWAKIEPLSSCYNQFMANIRDAAFIYKLDPVAAFYGLPRADILCDLIRTAGNCLAQSFQQCELTAEPARLIDELISTVEMKTKCSDQPKINSSELLLHTRQKFHTAPVQLSNSSLAETGNSNATNQQEK